MTERDFDTPVETPTVQPAPAQGAKPAQTVPVVAVVLAAAALLFVLYRANAPKAEPLVAVVDFGDGITETQDFRYFY